MKIKPAPLLLIFNGILLLMGWILALYSYPRLPSRIPLWAPLGGGEPVFTAKSPLFFLHPFLQAMVIAALLGLAHARMRRFRDLVKPPIFQEYAYLTLIFVNLIFIHLQRSLIFLAHGLGESVNPAHFLGLLAVILILIPYYRIRLKIAAGP